jgi:hypothetical protein
MKSLRAYAMIAPAFVKLYYRRYGLALRSVLRSFKKVAECNVNGILIKVGVSSDIEQFRAETYSAKEP